MKINEIIREKRIKKGLTQEQIASYLGVSTPAVNKWEKAISYPDITLLPALARLLDTDLNTLFSFQESLSELEIKQFLDELFTIYTTDGIEQAFSLAMDKLKEYPFCDILLLNIAFTLEGIISMSVETDNNATYLDRIESFYVRAAESKDALIANQAKSILISKYIKRNDFEKAKEELKQLPDECMLNKNRLQCNLYIAEENWKKAAQLTEQTLLLNINDVQTSLFTLIEIFLKEERLSEAEHILSIIKQVVSLFDLWEYGAYIADFQISIIQKDIATCLATLEKMLPAMAKQWNLSKSPLYSDLPQKENTIHIGQLMLPKILNDFENLNNHEYDFLRDNPKFQTLIADFKTMVK